MVGPHERRQGFVVGYTQHACTRTHSQNKHCDHTTVAAHHLHSTRMCSTFVHTSKGAWHPTCWIAAWGPLCMVCVGTTWWPPACRSWMSLATTFHC